MSNSILSVGTQGMQAGFARAAEAASSIARGGDDQGDLTTSLVDLKASEVQVKASAAVVKSADDMIGTLIDIKA
jgi:hypothetical protein